jgi:O-antigen/teichoic acid export membrane protein
MISKLKSKISLDAHFAELFKGSFVNFSIRILSMLLSYLVIIWITNHYGAKEFGVYTIGLTILSIAALIPIFGLGQGLVRIIAEFYVNNELNKVYSTLRKSILLTASLSILFSIALYTQADFFSLILNKPNLKGVFEVVSYAILPMALIRVFAGAMQGLKKIVQFSVISHLLIPSLFLMVLIVVNFYSPKIGILELYAISIIIAASIGLIIFKKSLPNISNIKTPSTHSLKEIIKTSYPMLLIGSSMMIMTWTDILMLSYYTTEEDVGIYAAAQRISTLISITLMSVTMAAAPKFVEFYIKNNMASLSRIVQQATKIIFFTSLPIFLIVFIAPNWIMSLFGPEFTIGVSALLLMAFSQLMNSLSGSVGYIMQMTNNQKMFQYIIISSSVLNILLNYLLIPIYGIDGAAFSSMVSMIVWNIVTVIFIKQKLGFLAIYTPVNLRKAL